MTTTSSFGKEKEFPVTLTGEPTDQLAPEEEDLDDDLNIDDAETDDEPYEGIRHGEEEDMVDDNMTGMPVVPSPS